MKLALVRLSLSVNKNCRRQNKVSFQTREAGATKIFAAVAYVIIECKRFRNI